MSIPSRDQFLKELGSNVDNDKCKKMIQEAMVKSTSKNPTFNVKGDMTKGEREYIVNLLEIKGFVCVDTYGEQGIFCKPKKEKKTYWNFGGNPFGGNQRGNPFGGTQSLFNFQ